MIRKPSPRTAAINGSRRIRRKFVVFAKSTADVSKLLQFASREKIPVTARGGGFGYVGGCVPAARRIALSLMRMNRIKEINFTDAVASC
jgi:glycolate oxidase